MSSRLTSVAARSGLHQRSRSAIRWQSMQRGAHGSASSRSAAIGRPQRTHVPNVPASSRARASSTSCELVIGPVAQGEVALLGEDLAGRRRLRSVGHLVRAPRSSRRLGRAGASRSATARRGSRRGRRRPSRAMVRDAVYSVGVPTRRTPMATEIDPVCGMERRHGDQPALARARRQDLLVLRHAAACWSSATTRRSTCACGPASRRCSTSLISRRLSAACDTRRRRSWTGHSSEGSTARSGRLRAGGGVSCVRRWPERGRVVDGRRRDRAGPASGRPGAGPALGQRSSAPGTAAGSPVRRDAR